MSPHYSILGLPVPRLPVLTAALLGALAAFTPAPAVAQEPAYATHIDRLYQGVAPRIAKWTKPMRYQVVGLTPSALESWRRLAREVGGRIGLSIVEDTSPDAGTANALFLFLDRIEEVASMPQIGAMFTRPEESEDAYLARMGEEFRAGWMTTAAYSEQSTEFVVQIINKAVYPRPGAPLFLRMLFVASVDVRASDAIKPSVMNVGPPRLTALAAVDVGFLAAVYNRQIPFGMALAEAKPILLSLMASGPR